MSQQNSRIKSTYKPESHVVLFGRESDPSVEESKRRLERAGRQVVAVGRPQFDTGLGMCGKHLCHCKVHCGLKFEPEFDGKAFAGDLGPNWP